MATEYPTWPEWHVSYNDVPRHTTAHYYHSLLDGRLFKLTVQSKILTYVGLQYRRDDGEWQMIFSQVYHQTDDVRAIGRDMRERLETYAALIVL